MLSVRRNVIGFVKILFAFVRSQQRTLPPLSTSATKMLESVPLACDCV